VPEWVAAQEELLALQRMAGADLDPLRDAARQRMRQLGMGEAQIVAVGSNGRLQRGFEVRAPIAGVLTEIGLREGMTVMAGATLFRVNGIGTVWAEAEVPESQSAMLRPGMKMTASSPALPEQVFNGRVQAILPEVNAATRTLKVRLELANPGARLVPGMFVQMAFTAPGAAQTLLVPSEAIIQTGQRTLVLLAEDGGRFRPVPVRIRRDSDGRTEVLEGLRSGQRVVVSSQFLIDSEASLRGIEARLNAAPSAEGPRYRTEARIEDIDAELLMLWHPPIAELKWGEMTMGFKPPASGLPKGLAVGDKVRIEFSMDTPGEPQITSLQRLAPAGAKR
jgi:Cu(I)/Ag(I) efflux system membrane fusion protein